MSAYTLNSVNLSTYGIVPGHAPRSNIALSGCFDLPARTGQTYYEWADDNTIEPYVETDEIFFAGRDIVFTGTIFGNNKTINDYLQALYDDVEAVTGLVNFVTPYGTFSVQIKTIVPEYYVGACSVVITFREPVVDLSGGTLPATGISAYMIDDIPMLSFGLYYSKGGGLRNLSELKEQLFTKYGSEGYQMSRRKNRSFEIKGVIMASSLSDFQDKIKALYLLFSSSGLRPIIINNEIIIECFAVEGFKVDGVYLYDNGIIANFNINLICYSVEFILLNEDGMAIVNEDGTLIYTS